MGAARVGSALAALLAVMAIPGTAHAAGVTQPFSADSGDACRYGVTEGSLNWRYSTSPTPLPAVAVDVAGRLADRPLPGDPSTACRDDGYYSTATFVAYAGTVAVDRQSRTVDNDVASFTFTLGSNTAAARVDRVVVQVCRSPRATVPPSYCGRAVTYLAPTAG